jgi:hypothetical protein
LGLAGIEVSTMILIGIVIGLFIATAFTFWLDSDDTDYYPGYDDYYCYESECTCEWCMEDDGTDQSH